MDQPIDNARTDSGAQPSASAHVQGVVRGLRAVRSRARGLLLAQGIATLIAAAVAICLAAGMIDYVLRTPWWLRLVLWIGGAVAAGVGAWRLIGPAARFKPTLTEVALRLERTEAGKAAGLTGVLAAGVELGRALQRGEVGGVGAGLAEPVVAEAAKRFSGVRAGSMLSGARVGRAAGWLSAAVLALVFLTALAPTLVTIGAARVLAPWSGVEWPKRTEIADATGASVHPLGVALPLRAAVIRGASAANIEGGTRVWGMYRITTDAGSAPVARVLLTNQGSEVSVEPAPHSDEPRRGVLFERLIEPGALLAAVGRKDRRDAPAAEATLEYWFQTSDDQTPVQRLRLVEPPSVVGATARVIEPSYARAPTAASGVGDAASKTIDLGPGNDERAVPAAMLAGSRIHMTIALNKPVPGPAQTPAERAAWARAALGDGIGALVERGDAAMATDGSKWELSWPLLESVRFSVRPRDEHGLLPMDESVYRFEAMIDQAPTAAVTSPETDEAVLATAVIDTVGEGRDDVGLSHVALERRAAKRPAGSQGAPAEAIEEWVEIGRIKPGDEGTDPSASLKQIAVAARLDLSQQSLSPGDEVWLTALAVDAYELEGVRHEPARSAVRRLTIISAEELAAQVWNELGSVRRTVIRLDEEQNRIAQAAPQEGQAAQAQRDQAAITERIARERKAIEKLQERVSRNRLADAEMQGLLNDAGALMDQAGQQSVDASRKVEEMAKAQESGAAATQEQKDAAAQSQRDVRDSLEAVADLLDKGQDAWSMKRAIQRALEEQQRLKDRTEQASRQTTGKSPDELTAEQKRELEQIARDQRSLAERTAEAIEKMLRDREQIKEQDEATAKAVEQAAKRGQRDRVTDRMNEAAQQVEENKANSATSDQQQAMQSLQQMLDDLNSAGANKDQELRRVLASLIDSIAALIAMQESQIEALEKAKALPRFDDLHQGVAALHQNTLGVAEQAGRGPRELAPVVDLLGKAADAQAAAVASLRRTPVDAEGAGSHEALSLERLRRAKEEAERIDQEAAEREADRKAGELRKAYREALTEQVAIKGDTDPLVGVEANRRTRATARAIGERQAALKDKLVEIQDQTAELSEAIIFEYAHKRLDEAMGAAATSLGEGDANTSVERNQRTAIRLLQSLVEALDRSKKNSDDFRDNQNGGGGGNQGPSPVVPPIAQLRLLRAMQVEAGEITRQAADEGDDTVAGAAAQLQQDLAERADTLLKQLKQPPGRNEPGGGDEGGRPQQPD